MTRLLFWIALIILVVMAVRNKLRGVLEPREPGPRPDGAQSGAQARAQAQARVRDESERMSCCAQCGLYFPASEAVSAGGREYCCAAHAHQAGN
jgi:uncharacterized protein